MANERLSIVERLRRKVQVQPAQGSGSLKINADGSCDVETKIWDDGKRLANPDGPEAADTIERLVAALERNGKALNPLIECLGSPMKSRTHYRWRRCATFTEGQEAMEANNDAAELLNELRNA
jgi:hypothetical protein